MKRLVVSSVALALAASAAVADPKESRGKPREGELATFTNMDARDAETRLKILQHETYELAQKLIALQFAQGYGDTIRMKFDHYASGAELIPAYVFTPKDMAAGQRRPAVVLLHGGFHERLNVEWFPLIDELVRGGYVVIFPEYRGSRGYGEELYANDYGRTDTADVLAAADYIATKDFVDPQRLAVVGESRGGMLTLLAIEQAPKRFKAAVDVVGLTDFVAYMAYKPEYRRQEVARENKGFDGQLPDKNLAAYMAVSPINHVDKIETPVLVLATTGDTIAPITLHTGRLLDALKARGKVHDSKIYDNAPGGHTFLHGDTPERKDAYGRILRWLDTHLKAAR
jgi:dipeptidyl aminopeptidase/acylaminoacyl peptidase